MVLLQAFVPRPGPHAKGVSKRFLILHTRLQKVRDVNRLTRNAWSASITLTTKYKSFNPAPYPLCHSGSTEIYRFPTPPDLRPPPLPDASASWQDPQRGDGRGAHGGGARRRANQGELAEAIASTWDGRRLLESRCHGHRFCARHQLKVRWAPWCP